MFAETGKVISYEAASLNAKRETHDRNSENDTKQEGISLSTSLYHKSFQNLISVWQFS